MPTRPPCARASLRAVNNLLFCLLLHTSAAFSPAVHRGALHRGQPQARRALASASASDADNRQRQRGDVPATAARRAAPSLVGKLPRLLADDDLPEAAALSAQLHTVAVKFSGIKSVRRLEQFDTTPSNEDFGRLVALTGAYVRASIRRVLEAPPTPGSDRSPDCDKALAADGSLRMESVADRSRVGPESGTFD